MRIEATPQLTELSQSLRTQMLKYQANITQIKSEFTKSEQELLLPFYERKLKTTQELLDNVNNELNK